MINANLNYLNRIKKLQDKCKKMKYDAFIVTSESNLYYLTGKSFFPFERPFILIVWAHKECDLLVPYLEKEHLEQIKHLKIHTYFEYPATQGLGWKDKLGLMLNKCSNIATGLYTRSEILRFLESLCKVNVVDHLYTQRYVKSNEEIEMLRKAAYYTNTGMEYFLKNIRYGSTVIESLETAKKSMQKATLDYNLNIDFYATNIVSCAWPAPRSSEPHCIPALLDQYKEGPHIIILSYRVNGYAVENERTFFTTKPSSEEVKYYNHMMKARYIALSMCKPGTACHDIDSEVKKYLQSVGLINNVIHRTGHGLGVTNHEGPFIAEGSDTILEKNMIITIEPGFYFSGVGGYRHSDTVLITENGYECLTTSPDDLESLTITNKSYFSIAKLKNLYLKKYLKK